MARITITIEDALNRDGDPGVSFLAEYDPPVTAMNAEDVGKLTMAQRFALKVLAMASKCVMEGSEEGYMEVHSKEGKVQKRTQKDIEQGWRQWKGRN